MLETDERNTQNCSIWNWFPLKNCSKSLFHYYQNWNLLMNEWTKQINMRNLNYYFSRFCSGFICLRKPSYSMNKQTNEQTDGRKDGHKHFCMHKKIQMIAYSWMNKWANERTNELRGHRHLSKIDLSTILI